MESYASRALLYIGSKGQTDRLLGCTTYVKNFFPFLPVSYYRIFLESRCIQQCQMKVSPVQTCYSPDGRSLLYASAGHQLFFMTLGKMGDETKEEWYPSERDAVCCYRFFKVSPQTYN